MGTDRVSSVLISSGMSCKPGRWRPLRGLHTPGQVSRRSPAARPPTRLEAEVLELDPVEWVVQILRASYSSEDTPVHTLETICAATRHVFPIGQVAGVDEF
jgi:hypothetical protein